MYTIVYTTNVVKKEIPLIPSPYRETIKKKIGSKLSSDPYKNGSPLSGNLKGHWKMRVGDYRVIYKIKEKEVEVLIITIDVRGNVYER